MDSIAVKPCNNPECPEENPQPITNFRPQKGCKDGLRPRCRTCLKEQERLRYAANPETKLASGRIYRARNPEKVRESKRKAYLKDPQKVKARSKNWRAANPERKLESDRLWRERNPEKVKASGERQRAKNGPMLNARSAAWRKTNQPRMCELGRLWRQANPEKVLEQTRRWRRENPERAALQRRVRYSRLVGADGSYTTQDLADKLELQGGLCYYCENELPEKGFDLDHKIPLSKGGSNWPANICLACRSCNRRKSDKDFWEFSGKRRP